MLNSPLAAPATADAQRLEMDQVRTTLSKQDPGQHRVDSRRSAATALATSSERENCRSMEKPANSEPHFAGWAANAAFLAGLHLSVVHQFGSHQFCSIMAMEFRPNSKFFLSAKTGRIAAARNIVLRFFVDRISSFVHSYK
jgi:hypothetical protein